MEECYEQHVIRKVNNFDKVLIYLRNICFFMFILYGILMNFTVSVIFLALWLFIFIICRNVFVDYDYEYCAGELVISQIVLKKKRKVIATLKTNQLLRVCQVKECKKTIHATIYKNETEVYVFQTSIGEIGFIVSFNEKMKNLITKGV